MQPQPARAEFGDCTSDEYLGRFPGAEMALGLDCVELFRIEVATAGGNRSIRGIQDFSADWAFSPGATAAVERGAQLTADALRMMGDFRVDNVTLLILDDADDSFFRGDEREVLAMTDGRGEPDAGRPGECLITLYMLGRGGNPDELAVTVAHEIFHCVQSASLSAARNATFGAGGNWWIEGSAEYFAALAVPESLAYTDRSVRFDEAVNSGTALNEMAHEAVILFYWLHGRRGPSGLMSFMHAMASTSGANAQHAAMRAVMPDDQWLQFAKDYADSSIRHPQGGALSSSPPGGGVLAFDENETLEYPLGAFVISLGTVEYECGTWENTRTPTDANVTVQNLGGGSWNSYPDDVDTREGEGNYRIVAMQTDSDESQLSIEVEQTVSCQPCGGTDRVDACLVGTWVMTGGGPIEWMRAQGVPITRSFSGPRIISFANNGIYGTGGFSTGITLREDDFVGQGTGSLTNGAGRWSADEGRMTICQDSGALSGSVTVTTPEVTMTGPISQNAAGMITQRYSCSPTSLSTSMDFPGMSPMRTQYSKVPEIEPPTPSPAPGSE